MNKNYLSRQVLIGFNHLAVILYLCYMAFCGYTIQINNLIHLGIVLLLFADAAYISYKNLRNNSTLSHFTYLLLLIGWQFLLSLFENRPIAQTITFALIPICFYQVIYFLLHFIFQSSAFRYQKACLLLLRITCIITVISCFLSERAFAFAYMAQFLLSLSIILFIIVVNHKRVGFVLKSQKRELTISGCFVLLPFVFYIYVFHNNASYLNNLGSYFIVMLVFMSIHSIVFQKQPKNFFAYLLTQIKREERLKRDFSNYLHDDVLQDILSIKNLVSKAEQPEVRQLLLETLDELNHSIRRQMQTYQPSLLKSLTLKENLQNMLDTLAEKHAAAVQLDCDDAIFLVEPYNVLIYRMMKELVNNALKHASPTEVQVSLRQEQGEIILQVTDNGTGFEYSTDSPGTHQGLASIQEQVGLLDGTLAIEPGAGTGTQITITMPMKGDESYENFVGR